MDVIHILMRSLSLIDGDLSKLGEFLSKVRGYTVKPDALDGTLCLDVEGDREHLDALIMALDECDVESDTSSQPNQTEKMQISRLYNPLPHNFNAVLSKCLKDASTGVKPIDHGDHHRRHRKGLNYSYPFGTLYQDRLRIATIGLIRSMLIAFPNIFSDAALTGSPLWASWAPDSSLRFDQLIRMYGISNPTVWEHIAHSIGRSVEECHVKVRENLRNRLRGSGAANKTSR
jgi:hypothetical protein